MLRMTTRKNTKIVEILRENESEEEKVDPIMKEFESDLGEASD